jgi:hypothetical protein
MASRLLFFVPYYLSGRWMRARVFDDDSQATPIAQPETAASAS